MQKKSKHPIAGVFLRGLALILPIALTAGLLIWLWGLLADNVVGRIDEGVKGLVGMLVEATADEELTPEQVVERADEVLPPGLRLAFSVVGTLALVLFLGWWLSGFIGRRLYAGFEKLLAKTPLIGAIYPYAKQITDFFFGQDRKIEFERVVAIPYPRRGTYSLAFLTGSSLRTLNEASGQELISVFIPSSPMPATGYTLFVPAEDIIPMNLTVDQALRIVISGGVLVPQEELEERNEDTRDALTPLAPADDSGGDE